MIPSQRLVKRGKVNAITRHAYVTGQNYFQVKIF